jgi:type II secretory pathway component PulJ
MKDEQLTTRDLAQGTEQAIAMFPGEETTGYRTRWDAIQTGFVDEPRKAVEEADALVAQVIKRLTEVFADERSTLEHQWDRGEQVSTEDLRQALRRYRSFFERLLAI